MSSNYNYTRIPYGNRVIVDDTPSRAAQFAALIQQMVGTIQDRQTQAQQQQDQQQQTMQRAQLAIAAAPPEQRAFLAKVFGVNYNPSDFPTDPVEEANRKVALLKAQQQASDLQGQGQPSALPVNSGGGVNFDTLQTMGLGGPSNVSPLMPNLPSAGMDQTQESPVDRAQRLARTYAYLTGKDQPGAQFGAQMTQELQGTPGSLQTNQIGNKQILNAQENQQKAEADRLFGQVTLPGSQATIAKTNAETGKAKAETGKAYAETAKTNAQTGQINSMSGDGEGGVNPLVQRWVTAARTAAQQGLDPNVVLKKIPDKKLAQAVNNELAKPENTNVLTDAPLAQQQKTALAEIDPLIQQTDAVIKSLEPYKTKNGMTDRMTVDYAKYRAGIMPDENTPAAQIANLQMLGVQAGARLLKGGSRAYQALHMAMQHAPNAVMDTYANAYDKAVKLRQQLQNVRDANARFGQPLTAQGAGNAPDRKPLDADTAKRFLDQAGGDKDRARQLAAAAGYTF